MLMDIDHLGKCCFKSFFCGAVSDTDEIPEKVIHHDGIAPEQNRFFELAGPRSQLYFQANRTKAGIVTCGGLCPGLNNVIRSLFLELRYGYGVSEVLGFRYGYQGLDPRCGQEPWVLTQEMVDDIHKEGGTILGTSRGPVDRAVAVENLIRRKINILFCIGGDGTQRGAFELYQAARQRGHDLAVVGVPKTIDNDVSFVTRTFGYLTAIEEARRVIDDAHVEAHSVKNGVAIVKLMGRYAGFIAAGATIASQDVNFALVPEIPFKLEGSGGFLDALKQRILQRGHAVIVIAEGAGQELLTETAQENDASGNIKLADIGPFLREKTEIFFRTEQIPITLRYFDPSYQIRSRAANCEDAILCDLFARNAVHAAMAGKTGLIIGLLHGTFIHVPINLIVTAKKRLEPESPFWRAVLAATGQPAQFK